VPGKGLLERLESDFVLCAEGYLFELERRGYVKAGPFVPEAVLDYPAAVEELHREFLRAGSDVIEAFTYYAHRGKLKVIGRESELEKMNRRALRIAKKVALEGKALLAGNICNTWVYNPEEPETHETVREMFTEQVKWAKEEGVDFVIAETIDYFGEALIALEVIKSFELPAVVTFIPDLRETRDGHSWENACRKLEKSGADVVGLNCGMGPATMLPLLEKARKKVKGSLAALPVPYRTSPRESTFQKLKDGKGKQAFPLNLEPFLLNREEVAEFAVKARKLGVNYLGLCCGNAPHFTRAMAEALGRTVPASRYSPDMSKHAMLGAEDFVRKQDKERLADWKGAKAHT